VVRQRYGQALQQVLRLVVAALTRRGARELPLGQRWPHLPRQELESDEEVRHFVGRKHAATIRMPQAFDALGLGQRGGTLHGSRRGLGLLRTTAMRAVQASTRLTHGDGSSAVVARDQADLEGVCRLQSAALARR
jgi:hypothetical protein